MEPVTTDSKKATFNPFIFRDYDIRGVVGKDFDETFAVQLAIALDQFFKEGPIVLSRDLRRSGIPLLNAMQLTLQNRGRKVINIKENPTPLLYYAICKEQAIAGIQITASHKPGHWNGFKINAAKAMPIDGETGIYKIRDLIVNNSIDNQNNNQAKGSVEEKNYREEYINEVTEKITLAKPLKIVIDTGNGSVGTLLQEILEKLGANAITINAELDDSFPNHQPDPHVDENLKQLQEKVLAEGADIGLALDGDGDRCGIIDNFGEIVSRDKTLMLLAKDALDKQKGIIVTEVRASTAYLDFIEKNGGTPVMAKAGHSFVLREVKNNSAVFGGELTGHMYFPLEFYDFDDGTFTAVKFVEILSKLNTTLNEHLKTLPEYLPSPESTLEVADEIKFEKIKQITKLVKQEGKECLDIDGVRITYSNNIGWLLIRASNTGPKIKCRFEAKTEENYNFLKSELDRYLAVVDLKID
tara:strand:+ start:577 stop:1986 length:1410 start_codon:yes stop_codon:yes gene_type:complete